MDAVGPHDRLVGRSQKKNHKGREGRNIVSLTFSQASWDLSFGGWTTQHAGFGWGRDRARGSGKGSEYNGAPSLLRTNLRRTTTAGQGKGPPGK